MTRVFFVLMVLVSLIFASNAMALELVNNAYCPVTGVEVNGKDYAVYEGRAFGLCCSGCIEVFESDAEKYIVSMSQDKLAKGKSGACGDNCQCSPEMKKKMMKKMKQ